MLLSKNSLEERKTFTITVKPDYSFSINKSWVSDGTAGEYYSDRLEANTDGVTWRLSSGQMPPGLSLASDGTISGTPTGEGSYGFNVIAEKGTNSETYHINMYINVIQVEIYSDYSAIAYVNQDFSFTFSANIPVTWSISGGLPAGLRFDEYNGILSGTPTESGSYTLYPEARTEYSSNSSVFTIQIFDGGGNGGNDGDIPGILDTGRGDGEFAIITTHLSDGTVGDFYNQTLASTMSYTGEVSWRVSNGALPPGLMLTDTGLLRGTPQAAAPFSNFEITAEYKREYVAREYFTLTINPVDSLTITTQSELRGTTTTDIHEVFAANINQNITWYADDNLPYGLVLNSDSGLLVGKVDRSGVYMFTIRATGNGMSATKYFTLTITGEDSGGEYPYDPYNPGSTTEGGGSGGGGCDAGAGMLGLAVVMMFLKRK